MSKRIIDLSHTIRDGMITYPGLPGPKLDDFLSREASRDHYQQGTTFQIARIEMVTNTGTYLDSPYHRYEEGPDLAGLSLESLVDLEGVLVSSTLTEIGADVFERDVEGKAVLVQTGWDRHWGHEDYGKNHPHLNEAAALLLRDRGAALVGIDSLNIDGTKDGARPVHSILLEAGIPIVEHLTGLDALLDQTFRFSAVPPKVAGCGSFPVRAFAVVGS